MVAQLSPLCVERARSARVSCRKGNRLLMTLLHLTTNRGRYQVIIFTNQGGIKLKGDQKRLQAFKGKVAAALNQLGVSTTVYAAMGKDHFRKPRTGMWKEMLEDYDLDADQTLDTEGYYSQGTPFLPVRASSTVTTQPSQLRRQVP